MKTIFAILILFLVIGCTTPPEPPEPNGTDNNIFIPIIEDRNTNDINSQTQLIDSNKIRLDLDLNKIYLNFEVDLNSPNLDLNILTTSCRVSCDVIDANTWRVHKDLNFGIYFCTCTKTICYGEEETSGVIYRYCRDHSVALQLVEGKDG